MRLIPLIAVAAAVACSRPDPAPEPQAEPPTMSSAAADTSLVGPQWSLVELNGRPAGTGAGGRAATLEFIVGGRVAGFGGCNRIAGPYLLAGDSLRLGPLVMTRMACDAGMDLETAFAAALDSVSTYRLEGTTLELMGANEVLARLEAR
jgi:heat shock protein HslJ